MMQITLTSAKAVKSVVLGNKGAGACQVDCSVDKNDNSRVKLACESLKSSCFQRFESVLPVAFAFRLMGSDWVKMLINVVLPLPDGPKMAVTDPSGKSSFIDSKTVLPLLVATFSMLQKPFGETNGLLFAITLLGL